MAYVRIFKTREEAEIAKKILADGGIDAEITEDKFNNVPIQNYGVQARFRLMVSERDFYRAASYLAKRLKEGKVGAGE